MQIAVSSAIGGVRITAPPTIGIELQSTGLLARTSFDGAFTKSGSVWRSANFTTSSVKVRIVVKSMLGKIELVQR
jgi:predicted membrane protein